MAGNLTGSTARQLVPAEWRGRRPGDIVEWTEVLLCECVQDFVDQNGNLVPNSLRHVQPVETVKCIGDVVGSTQMVCKSRCRVQH